MRMYPFLWLSESIKKVIVKCSELLKEAPFGYGKHAAGAVPSGFDSIHLEMTEFAEPFDAGRAGVNGLSRRVFFCLPFLPLNAPPAFMPEQRPIYIKQEAGVQPAVNTDCGCLAFKDGICHLLRRVSLAD